MKRKRNETQLGRTFRSLGYVHKFRDRGYINCPQCEKQVSICPHCGGSLLLEKADTKPDYLVALDYVYIEGKGAEDRWDFTSSIRDIQRAVMQEHESYLFLEIGKKGGRAPNGRQAYLVPWEEWLRIETGLVERKIASLIYEASKTSRNPTVRSLLSIWELTWQEGRWCVPEDHVFFERHQRGIEHGRLGRLNKAAPKV